MEEDKKMQITKQGITLTASVLKGPKFIKMWERLELIARTLQSKGIDTSLRDQIKSVSSVLPNHGAIVFDVGANKGFWTQALLQQVGTRIDQVHCFEPSEVNIAEIRKLKDPRISIHPYAVGAQTGQREFYSDFPGSGIASLFKRDTPDAPKMSILETVTVRRLDDIIDELGLDRVDLLKMDIEGAEMEALQGLFQSFEKRIIGAFTFEIGAVNVTSRTFLSDFFDFASTRGFEIYRLTAGGGLYRLTSYRVSHECFATTNYLAWQKSAASTRSTTTALPRLAESTPVA